MTNIEAPADSASERNFTMLPRFTTGTIFPRKEMTPYMPKGILGVLVMKGVLETSLTLKTFIPNISEVPNENRSISSLLEPASFVLASTDSSKFPEDGISKDAVEAIS